MTRTAEQIAASLSEAERGWVFSLGENMRRFTKTSALNERPKRLTVWEQSKHFGCVEIKLNDLGLAVRAVLEGKSDG